MTAPVNAGRPGIGLRDVTVRQRDGSVVLEHLSLQVEPGELLAVVGPSGSGKTTLLRAVAGLAKVSTGTVLIRGVDVTRMPVQSRDVAMVFEAGGLLPHLNVENNMGFSMQLRRRPDEEVRERVSSEARQLWLTRLLKRKPGRLSAGEQGRVALGRALTRTPAVWLMDEPLAHLDAFERASVRHRLVEEVTRLGISTMYVTHDPAEALAVGGRVAVLRRGSVVQVDTPRELYERPVDLFVADFMGSHRIGLLPARVVTAGGLAGFRVGARTLPFWAPVPAGLEPYVGADVVLALRPEAVHDAEAVQDPAFAHLPGTVVATEYTGEHRSVTVEVAAPPVVVPGLETAEVGGGARLQARFAPDSNVRIGATVMVAVDATRAHVFAPDTGAALWHPADQDVRPGGAAAAGSG